MEGELEELIGIQFKLLAAIRREVDDAMTRLVVLRGKLMNRQDREKKNIGEKNKGDVSQHPRSDGALRWIVRTTERR
jgi:hypothetical protein